jgi:S-DNA-T family DNA segregation ATPase FtsK/SpoIIIE
MITRGCQAHATVGESPFIWERGFCGQHRKIGFHLLIAQHIVDLGRTNYDPIFLAIKDMEGTGLLMRGNLIEGWQALHNQSVSAALPPGRGLLVRRNAPGTLVQVARVNKEPEL